MPNTSIAVATKGPVATAGSTLIRLNNKGMIVPTVAATTRLAQVATQTTVGNRQEASSVEKSQNGSRAKRDSINPYVNPIEVPVTNSRQSTC